MTATAGAGDPRLTLEQYYPVIDEVIVKDPYMEGRISTVARVGDEQAIEAAKESSENEALQTALQGIASSVAAPVVAGGGAGVADVTQEPTECSGGQCSCFVAGTSVDTTAGEKRIEKVELGSGVGPESGRCDGLSLVGWSEVDLSMSAAPASEGAIRITLLRSPEWVQRLHVKLGGSVLLDLEEWGIHGQAVVTKIAKGPALEPGARCPVTGTIRHLSDQLISLRLDGADDILEVTRHHRLFSADRQDWVEAGALQVGESLSTKEGTARVLGIRTERRAPEEVFNLEVIGDHAYFAGDQHVLAHNECANGGRWLRSMTVADKGAVFKRQKGACAACGIEMTRSPGPRQMQMDHRDPYATHGPIDPLEAQGLCRTCNLEKGATPLRDWLDYVSDWVWTTSRDKRDR